MCSEQDPLSHFKRLQMEIFGFSQKETGTKSVVMQQHRCHSVSFVMQMSGAKFEEDCSNISGDIFASLFYILVPSATRLKMPLTSSSGHTQKFEFFHWLTKNQCAA